VRIVGGKFRGRTIAAPRHEGLRPTADRVRESIFNILAHGMGDFEIEGARVIDLFAGTGALGLEAMSRGAAFCLFVEESPEARALIRTNVESLGLTGETRIFRRDASNLGVAGTMTPFTLAFLDPPYEKGLGETALQALHEGGWLTKGAMVVLEERMGATPLLPSGYIEIDRRDWGDTQAIFARHVR
jgi:16S rRNA (guanine966-N2)-methyltransferase